MRPGGYRNSKNPLKSLVSKKAGLFDFKIRQGRLPVDLRGENTTRVCTRCGFEKDIEQFPLRNRFTTRRQSYCKDCRKKYGEEWYETHKDHQKENSKVHRVEYRQNLREYAMEYLSTHPREHCGETDPVVLEFHHTGKKEADISVLIGRGSTLEKLKAEISQCQVLCSNCHRRVTAKERGWFRGK